MTRRRKSSGIEGIGVVVVAVLAILAATVQWLMQHPEIIVLAIAAGGGVLAIRNRNARSRAEAEQRAIRELQAANDRRILNDCLTLCRNSAKAPTRVSRATLALEKIQELLRVGALDNAEASNLDRYFHAVIRSAAAVEAFSKGSAAGTERTRRKRLAEARAAALDAGLTDEILHDAEAINHATGAPLSLADVAGDEAAVAAMDDDVLSERQTAAISVQREPLAFTISIGPTARRSDQRPSNARWVPPGETVQIGHRTIRDGMLWVGSGLTAVSGYGDEPALIDPDLEVDEAAPDLQGDGMPYWPSYGAIGPRCRAAYLTWLAGARVQPDVGLGYVFLFYYGLERRVLDDQASNQPSLEEVAAIRAEIVRLIGQHPRSSFPAYAHGLLDYIDARWQLEAPTVTETARRYGDAVPIGVRAALGRAALTGEPVPAALALAWVRSHPSPGLGRSLTGCAAEFDALFLQRYAATFGAGLVIKPNRARITHRYRPASASFGGREARAELDLPDPTQLSGPWNRLHAIAERCCNDLDPFRRLVTRRPDARGGPEGFAALPVELNATPPLLAPFRAWAESTVATADVVTTDSATLFRLWRDAGGQTGRPRPTSVAIAQVLSRWDIGIEPDTRFGAPAISEDGSIVLFRNPRPCADAPSDGYEAAAVASQLCAVAASADGHVHPDEVEALDSHLAVAPGLDDAERRRLLAHFHWSLVKPPSMTALTRRLRVLPTEGREGIAALVLQLITGDGHADPADLKLLARVYKALELDPGRIHGDIHRALVGETIPDDDPVVVHHPGGTRSGFAIPAHQGARTGVVLDHERVQQRVAESARVAHMLGSIFADDDPAPAPPTDGARLSGLDAAHSALLRRLSGSASIPRAVFEQLAADTNLLPDGAIETLNDAAFAAADAPLCEGDDPIELDQQVLEVMLR